MADHTIPDPEDEDPAEDLARLRAAALQAALEGQAETARNWLRAGKTGEKQR